MSRSLLHILVLLALCLASRVASTVYYVEDTDSLRFALSVADAYDVTRLQPHFPGYPVFWALARPLYLITGRFAVAFSLVGGLAVFVTIYCMLRVAKLRLDSPEGLFLTALLFFNPLFWLLSNRYMPDAAGLACALAAFYFLASGSQDRTRACIGLLLAGILAGLRLSYLPFLAVPAMMVLFRGGDTVRKLAFALAGVLVWFVPLVIDTGWDELIAVAWRQTEGHFTEFGGTIQTNPSAVQRVVRGFEGLWADGLGAYWPGRHPTTVVVAVGAVVLLVAGVRHLDRLQVPAATRWMMVASWVVYAIWIGLFQNIIYKSRHVLPLLPFVLLLIALGGAAFWRYRRPAARLVPILFLACYAAVTLVLVVQHRQPTAIAQVQARAAAWVRSVPDDSLYVVSIPLVNFYLSAHGTEAQFLDVDDEEDLERLRQVAGRAPLFVVGTYPGLIPGTPTRVDTFYHNPYVNRMWSEVEVYEYDGTR